MNILNLLTAKDLRIAAGQKNYTGADLDLAKKFGAEKLGFHLEVIVRCNNEFRKVSPGDVIFYRTGPETAHNMYNHTDKPFKFLAISNVSGNDACQYPDSKKISSPNGFMQNGQVVNYFKDEEDPAKYWPEHALRGDV